VSYSLWNQYFDGDEPVIPPAVHSVECIHGVWVICLLQEDGRALSVIQDGFATEHEARAALREMHGETGAVPKRWPALVVASLLTLGAFIGVWLSR
jgi:hypothetical protein